MNARQKRFVTEYMIDMNATQAAIRAGYSEKTAYSSGQRLLKNVEVESAIYELKKRQRADNICEADEVEEFLSLMMNGEIQEEVVTTEGTGDGHSESRIIFKQASARDRLKAAELLAKRFGLLTDKQDITLNVPVVFEGEDEIAD